MIGAIVGDIAGSRFEWCNIKCKKFALFAGGDEALKIHALMGPIAYVVMACCFVGCRYDSVPTVKGVGRVDLLYYRESRMPEEQMIEMCRLLFLRFVTSSYVVGAADMVQYAP